MGLTEFMFVSLFPLVIALYWTVEAIGEAIERRMYKKKHVFSKKK